MTQVHYSQRHRRPEYSGNKQKGVALIVVLLIVALVTILATQMSNRLQLNIARTMNIKDNNQAYWYALGAEQFAKKSLRTLMQTTPNNINLSQPWAAPFEFPLENAVIKAQLVDLQACFNINAVGAATAQVNPSTGGGGANNNSGSSGNNGNNNNQQGQGTAGPTQGNQPGTVNGKLPSVLAFEDLLGQYIDDSLVIDTLRDSIIDWLDKDSFSEPYGQKM